MERLFRLILPIAILLIAVSLILGACAPIRQTSVPPIPASESAAFIASDLTIAPEAIAIGESSMIGVTVTNTGEQPGTYPVVLKANGDIAETQNVTLAGGASQNITFIYTPFNMRDYEVVINQLKGFLKVSCEVP